MDNLLDILLKDTYTLSQLKHKLKIIKSQLSQKFFGGGALEPLTPKDSTWFSALPENFLGEFNKDNLSLILTYFSNQINKMETLTIYLSFDAGGDILDQIGIKTRTTFGKIMLLDVKYNPALIAGCAISWKGIYKDYSLHSRIGERKLAILQSFKKFLR